MSLPRITAILQLSSNVPLLNCWPQVVDTSHQHCTRREQSIVVSVITDRVLISWVLTWNVFNLNIRIFMFPTRNTEFFIGKNVKVLPYSLNQFSLIISFVRSLIYIAVSYTHLIQKYQSVNHLLQLIVKIKKEYNKPFLTLWVVLSLKSPADVRFSRALICVPLQCLIVIGSVGS